MSSLVIYENKSKLKSSKSTLVCALGTLYNLESHIKILPHFNLTGQIFQTFVTPESQRREKKQKWVKSIFGRELLLRYILDSDEAK